MAEQRNLEVKITANTQGLKDIASEAKKVGSEVEKSGKQTSSTFGQMTKGVSTFSRATESANVKLAAFAGAIGGVVATAAISLINLLTQIASKLATLPFTLASTFASYADQIGRASKETGLHVETLSILGQIAKQNDADLRTVSQSIKELNKSIAELVSGSGNGGKALRVLGIDLKDVRAAGGDLNRIFPLVAERLGQVEDHSIKVALATHLFGQNGQRLIPILDELVKGGDDLAEKYREAGIVLSEDAVKSGKEFKETLDDIKLRSQGLGIQLGGIFLPLVADVVDELRNWVDQNDDLVKQKVKEWVDGAKAGLPDFIQGLRDVVQALKDLKTFGDSAASALNSIDQGFKNAGKSAGEFAEKYGRGIAGLSVIASARDIVKNFGLGEGGREIKEYSDAAAAAITTTNRLGASIESVGGEYSKLAPVAKTAAAVTKDVTIEQQRQRDLFKQLLGPQDRARSAIDNLNQSMERQIETLKIANVALEQNKFAAIEAAKAAFLYKGGSAALADEFERLSKQKLNTDALNDLRSNIAGIVDEISKLGKGPEAIARIDAASAKANLAMRGYGEEILSVVDGMLALQLIVLRFKAKEKLESEFKSLDIVEVQVRNVREEFANLVNTVLKIAATPDLSEKFGIDFARANEIIIQATAQVQRDIRTIEMQAYADRLKLSTSFWDQMKGGIIEFALSVETNGELAAQFFADTLSQMSQNFSDLFYNVLTGKFDDLVDVAKNAFRAILRAFLDMVAAISTRQIVISIAGAIGVDTKGAKATDILGLGKDAVGAAGLFGGIFGGGAAAGGATAAAIGGAAGGVGSVGVSGLTAGIPVSTLAGGGSTGVLGAIGAAAPYVGAVLAAAALAYSILGPLLKKTPRLDIDFDSVKTDMGRRAAVVEEFLSPEFFLDNIGQVSVKRGGVGLGAGGDEKILELIQQRIQDTIEGIQDIIRRLPAELFDQLNETLLNAEIDIDTVIGGERLLEFDAKGKKIAEKFQAFIEGELPAKFFLAIRESFFEPAFQALGVSADGAKGLIDDFLAKMEAAGSREERAIIGQEFIEKFSAFVDAFNIVSGNANDAIGQTMNTIKGLANSLGFEAVPSIEALRAKLGELIENAEIDPEVVQQYADLRNAIVSLTAEVVGSISGLIGKMISLNQTMASLGMATVDMSSYLSQAASQIQSFLQNNQGQLSLSEQEAFLDQLTGIANTMLQEEMAAFNASQEKLRAEAQAAFEAERAAIQGRIEGLNQEKERINEAFRARIDALNEELRLAQAFAQLAESIRGTLDSIIFSQQSIFTGVERVNMLQTDIAALQSELSRTTDPDRQLDLAKSLESAFKTLFDTAGEAFGVNSPEFVSIFDQVTGGLSSLADLTESRGRSVEEINAEIERLTAANNDQLKAIDASIQAAQQQMSSLQQQTVDNTFVASQELQDLFKYIQGEQQRLLDDRFKQLGEINTWGFQTETEGLGAIAGISESSLVTLKEQSAIMTEQLAAVNRNGMALDLIAQAFTGKVPGFAGGSGGLQNFGSGTFAMLHGKEAVITEPQMRAILTGGANLSNFTERLARTGYLSNLTNEQRTPEQIVRGRTSDMASENSRDRRFDVYIHSDNPATVQTVTRQLVKELAHEMKNEIDRSAADLKGAVQNASRKAIN